jgi:zinc/manganese transport system ATP-binding protein
MGNENVISIENLCYVAGGQRILHEMSIDIKKGEFVAVLGPNGVGKTTLLKLLLGLLKPTRGRITLLGKTPQRGNDLIGYAPQRRVLETDLALRARDVVGFGLDGNRWGIGFPSKQRKEIIDRALDDVDALQFASAPVGHLSGGEQQRLLIAQALITSPKILLLDEPLSNLDIHHTQDIIALLVKLAKGRGVTIMLVAHDVNPLLPVIDRVLFMANGQSAIGTPDKILTKQTLSRLYNTPIEVVKALDRVFVVGAEI